jgi:flavin reductase (DIM6/NTAB) family NADH-FMN oxidoreductase RutF
MKTDVEYLKYMWPMRTFLITSVDKKGKPNIIAVSFCMPVSKTPPLLACAITVGAYSSKLIEETGEFVVNVPLQAINDQIDYCGYHSGSNVDKFKETGLTPKPARRMKAPIIDECVAHMECKLRQVIDAGDKKLYVGEVVEAYADQALESGKRTAKYAEGDFPAKVYSTRFGVGSSKGGTPAKRLKDD